MVRISGMGSFCYPPIKVTMDGNDKPLEKVQNNQREIIVDLKLSEDIRVIVTNDGFFAPIMDGDDSKIEKFLNTIFSTLITKGIQAQHTSMLNDRAGFQSEEGSSFLEVGHSRSLLSIRNLIEFEDEDQQQYRPDSLRLIMHRHVLSKSLLEELIKRAYDFYKNPDYADDLILVGEAWSLSFDRMDNASFLYAWMIIENFLEQTWKTYTGTLQRTSNEKDFLKNHSAWSVSHYIQSLSMVGKIDDITRQTLNKLRQIRNSIVHDRHVVTQSESTACMSVATDLIYNKLNFGDSFLSQQTKLKGITLEYQ